MQTIRRGVCVLLGVSWCTTIGVPWCTTVHKHGVQYQTMSLLLHPDTRLQVRCSIFFCMLSCLIGANFTVFCLKNRQYYLCQPWYIWFLRCWHFCCILWLVYCLMFFSGGCWHWWFCSGLDRTVNPCRKDKTGLCWHFSPQIYFYACGAWFCIYRCCFGRDRIIKRSGGDKGDFHEWLQLQSIPCHNMPN